MASSSNKNNSKLMSIAHLNVRSLFTGFTEFQNLIYSNDFDVVAVTETWLSDHIPSSVVNMDNYKLYF